MKKGWQTKALGEVCEFQRGLTYSKSDEVDLSDNVVLRAMNIDLASHLLDFTDLKYISDKFVVPENKKVKLGSLMICTASGSKSHLGKIAFIDEDYGYAFGGFMGMLTPSRDLDPKFLFHLMTSGGYEDFIGALADGMNINNLKFDELKQFQVPFPTLPEQRRIVGILDEAFEGLATAKANAEKNLHNARALFDSHLQAVFSQRGEGWVERRLEEVADADCSLSYGIVQPGDEYPKGMPVVRPTDLTTKVIRLGGLKRIDPTLAGGYKRTALQGGELLLCVRGSTGLVSIASPELVGANVTRGIVPIRFNRSLLLPEFGFHLISSAQVQGQIREKTYGAALMQINIRDLRVMLLSFPPLNEQVRITARLDSLYEETQRLAAIYQQKLAALEALKKSLLHQAFTGNL